MPVIFERATKLLQEGLPLGSSIIDIQIALKLLGFMPNNYYRQCDGKRGKDTNTAIKALNWTIFEREEDITIDYGKITELLLDKEVNWFKVPFVEDPDAGNIAIFDYLKSKKDWIIDNFNVPYDFIHAILWQETGLKHYDLDGFIFVGCDTGTPDYKYRSRGWGMGQYTISNHPPSKKQQKSIVDPIRNIEFTCNHLWLKFKLYCGKLKICQYPLSSEKYLRDCKKCVGISPRATIVLPKANYHSKAMVGYKDIPLLDVCGWGLAVERYNGAGQNAIAYKYEVLSKIEGEEIR
ncbi:MAG: hypothetical protein ACOYWZ_16095 [Bacillota bacterium]